jgi:hypothetical protein
MRTILAVLAVLVATVPIGESYCPLDAWLGGVDRASVILTNVNLRDFCWYARLTKGNKQMCY